MVISYIYTSKYNIMIILLSNNMYVCIYIYYINGCMFLVNLMFTKFDMFRCHEQIH